MLIPIPISEDRWTSDNKIAVNYLYMQWFSLFSSQIHIKNHTAAV